MGRFIWLIQRNRRLASKVAEHQEMRNVISTDTNMMQVRQERQWDRVRQVRRLIPPVLSWKEWVEGHEYAYSTKVVYIYEENLTVWGSLFLLRLDCGHKRNFMAIYLDHFEYLWPITSLSGVIPFIRFFSCLEPPSSSLIFKSHQCSSPEAALW